MKDSESDQKPPDIATKIMAAMVRMPPKPHEEMKLGKSKGEIGPKNKPSRRGRGK
jgi:hypothetical protein